MKRYHDNEPCPKCGDRYVKPTLVREREHQPDRLPAAPEEPRIILPTSAEVESMHGVAID